MRDAAFPNGGLAVIAGAGGGIGAAVSTVLEQGDLFARTLRLRRGGEVPLDLQDESTIAAAANAVSAIGLPLRLMFVATGFLFDSVARPERSVRDVSPEYMATSFALNAIGPALLLKHFLPLLPKSGKAVFAVLSAKVGSIGDNQLGGWHSYRASKAALNQIVRTASIELARSRPDAICVALHPGTVATALSAPFAKRGLDVRPPDRAATEIINVIANLTSRHNGAFLDYRGAELPW